MRLKKDNVVEKIMTDEKKLYEIKEAIAIALKSSTVGLTFDQIADKTDSRFSYHEINAASCEMERESYIKKFGDRYSITPKGRSFYSELNKETEPMQDEIELIEKAFRTPDGVLHENKQDAEMYWLKANTLKQVKEFIAAEKISKKQTGPISSYIIRWELYKAKLEKK